MATFGQTSEADPQLFVVRFTSELAWADAGPEAAEAQVERLCRSSRMYGDSIVTKSKNPNEILEMAKLISAKVAQQPNDRPLLHLKILFNLYNLLSIPYAQFCVYMQALSLAVNGKVVDHITPSFKKIDNFLKEWNLDVKVSENFFLPCEMQQKKVKAEDSFKLLIKYLATFSGEDARAMGEAREEAVRAIVELLKAPNVFQCYLLDMPAVMQLEKDSQYPLAHQLLKIFLTQQLDSYLEFQYANSSFLKDFGLIHEDCATKMRLMSLVDLGSNESGHIPYAVIRDTLKINHDEVEYWVVKAISARLLDCKMHQMNEVVIVSRCSERGSNNGKCSEQS